MEVFEAPKKDAKGRVVNPEDAEARQAAREKNAARKKQPQAAQPAAPPRREAPHSTGKRKRRRGKGQGAQQPQAAAPALAPQPAEKPRRTFPHGKQNLGNLEDFLAAQPTAEESVTFHHRDPWRGDVIMDATARLLAAKPVYHYYKPSSNAASHKKEGQGARKAKAAPGGESPPRPPRRPQRAEGPQEGPRPGPEGQRLPPSSPPAGPRGRIPPSGGAPKSRQKDSTEQQSLMKPFYIEHD